MIPSGFASEADLKVSDTRLCRWHTASCFSVFGAYATGRSLSLCVPQSSRTLSRATTSSAQVGDRYVRPPELNCFLGSLAHVQQYLRAHWKGNRRLVGHRTPPSLLKAGVSESRITFEKRASPERSTSTLLASFVRGRGFLRPQPNAKASPACLRLLREQASFARSSWPPQSFGLQEYRRPLSPGPSALLDSFHGDRPPRPLSCPID